MKKILIYTLFIFSLFFIINIVNAEEFTEGDYLSGEYIKKVYNGKSHYLTMQYIKDSKGEVVYCLEPYTKFYEDKTYTEYEKDLSKYEGLTDNQKRRISLIIYYGYGYNNHTSNKWYAVTQYLIWQEIGEGDIYFTDTLNGDKITKYEDEQKELLALVKEHDKEPDFIKEYEIDYNNNLNIKDLDSNYEIVSSSYKYTVNKSSTTFKNIKEDGTIEVRKASNYYDNNVTIYDSDDSQDLIKAGNIENEIYTINIKVLKGNIKINIYDDDSIYTVESEFKPCYDILKDSKKVDSVCATEELTYLTVDLEYGEYEIKQTSTGSGYKEDTSTYKVTIDSNNNTPEVSVYNYLIKNKIEIQKYACKNSVCAYEEGAIFDIYDINNNLVNSITTNKTGYGSLEVGYGSYTVKQSSGKTDYSYVDNYVERIVDEEEKHYQELFNNYIEEEDTGEVLGVAKIVEDIEDTELPPNTKVDKKSIYKILKKLMAVFKTIFIVIFAIIRNY